MPSSNTGSIQTISNYHGNSHFVHKDEPPLAVPYIVRYALWNNGVSVFSSTQRCFQNTNSTLTRLSILE